MGEAGEAQNIAHQAKKMEVEAMRAFRDRFSIPISDEDIEGERFRSISRPRTSPEMRVSARARRGARQRPAAAPHVGSRWPCPNSPRSTRSWRAPATAQISTTMAFVRVLNTIARDRDDRAARRADRRRRVAHVRHGRDVPPARHLLVGRPALPPARRRAADVVPRRQDRPDSAGRHQRGRRDLVVDRRRARRTRSTTCR